MSYRRKPVVSGPDRTSAAHVGRPDRWCGGSGRHQRPQVPQLDVNRRLSAARIARAEDPVATSDRKFRNSTSTGVCRPPESLVPPSPPATASSATPRQPASVGRALRRCLMAASQARPT